ncbi:MAG: DUF1707 and DUF2154 domain-containing protein [Deltaproteobacteria bacterium]|nr:MAG: DUF1707 and DUF2154 domain-containing protein [Deltaproteobacteria bacterium]
MARERDDRELRAARERAIEHISACYAHDVIGVDELERRVGEAERAATVADLDRLVADIDVPPEARAIVPRAPAAMARGAGEPAAPVLAGAAPASQTVVAVFGGADRKGAWVVPRKLRVWAAFGGADIDFREARLAPGEHRVSLFALCGGIDVIVPPGLHVEVDGAGILGGFGGDAGTEPPADPDAPRLVITGVAVLGGIDVVERLPGESGWAARRRRRRERKARAKRERARRLEGKK